MSRRFIVGLTACCLAIAVIYGVLAATVRQSPTICPQCKALLSERDMHRKPESTSYQCRKCLHFWTGPARSDFSWFAAAEEYLSQ